ncbi:MAG: FAD-binding oxidoreductase [Bacteroidota bacterium]
MKGYVRATVAERLDVTHDLAVFKLDWGEPFSYEPGQYVTLALDRDGRTVKRAYSIVSAPHEPQMELHIEHVADGALTPGLFALHPGDPVWARRKIVGHFTQELSKQAHAMVATVTGAAPFISMIRAQRHALDTGVLAEADASRYLLLHGASDPAELAPYAADLADLAAVTDWLAYVPIVSRPWNHPGWTGERGRVGDVLRKHLDAWTGRHGIAPARVVGYACGNPQMIEHAKGIFKRAGLQAEFIRDEKYYTEDPPNPVHVFDAAGAQVAARQAKPSGGAKPKGPGKRPPLPPGLAKLKAVKPGRTGGAPPRTSRS